MYQQGQVQIQMPPISPVVRIILITCTAVFLLQLILEFFFHFPLSQYLGFIPARWLSGWVWQPFTYAFLHGGIFHILFNLLVVWSIGAELEYLWGSRFFTLFYFTCVLGAALTYGIFSLLGLGLGADAPVIGSSGAVYGLLLAYGILYGERLLYLFMLFPLKARYFVMILGAIELISSVFYAQNGIAHTAHLGGMATGYLLLVIRARWRNKPRKTAKPSHLRLVKGDDEDPQVWH